MQIYLFDDQRAQFGFTYDGEIYYYNFSSFGDVMAIRNSAESQVVEYTYDAWGKVPVR